MKQRLLVALLTVVVFAAGFGARIWTECEKPLPPPPASLGAEFAPAGTPEKKVGPNSPKPYDRAELVSEIMKLQPQVDAFRQRGDAIDAEYERAFLETLHPDQRANYDAKLVAMQKHRAERDSKMANLPPPPPLSDDEIARIRQRPFELMFWKIAVSAKLEQVVKDHKLDAAQQVQVRALLVVRREKFVELIDSTPMPTVRMTALAPLVQRLGDPAKPGALVPATPAK